MLQETVNDFIIKCKRVSDLIRTPSFSILTMFVTVREESRAHDNALLLID